MKDLNQTDQSNRREHVVDMLRAEAKRIPAPEYPGLVAQVVQRARTSPKRAVGSRYDKNSGRIPGLIAGAAVAAAIAIAVVNTIVIPDAVSPTGDLSPTSNLPRQGNLPGFVELRVDPLLASRERDLAGELQYIRADLDSIGRMISIRLKSDT